MKIDLSGRTAIVTGSTGGIGFAIARGLAACGATVVANARRRRSGHGCHAGGRTRCQTARGHRRPFYRHRLRRACEGRAGM